MMKDKTEQLLLKELDEIEAYDFVTTFAHLQEKIAFISHDIRNEFPEESIQLIEINEIISDALKTSDQPENEDDFIRFKADVALILKQILEIDD